jgi:hypothetical protein
MTVKEIKVAVERMMTDNAERKASIDKAWNSHYGDLSCVEYEFNAGELSALTDIMYVIEHGDESREHQMREERLEQDEILSKWSKSYDENGYDPCDEDGEQL